MVIQNKTQEKINKIRSYFIKKTLDDSSEKVKFIITEFRVEEREREMLSNAIELHIKTNVINPKNSYLEEHFFIALSKTSQVRSLLAFRHSKKYSNLIKQSINRQIK